MCRSVCVFLGFISVRFNLTETPLILVARGASAGYVVNNKINLMCVFFVSGGGGGQESDYLF